MNNQSDHRRLSPAVLAGICGFIVVTGGGIAWWTLNAKNQTPISPIPSPNPTSAVIIPVPSPSSAVTLPSPTLTQPTPPIQTATGNVGVTIYWFQEKDGKLQLVASGISTQPEQTAQVQLEKAFNQLLSGSTPPNVSTAIPTATKLLNLSVKNEGIYLDLSREFTQGGGSASMIARLGQVIYTATSLKPDASVWISVEGKPLEVLGGEGLEVPQPITRPQFHKNFSP